MPGRWDQPCTVVCRACKDYEVEAPDLHAAQTVAWSHDVDHWRRRIPPTTTTTTTRNRR